MTDAQGTRRLRALLVTMDYPPTRGGIQTMAKQIVTRASSVDWEVLAPADAGHEQEDASSPVPVKRVRSIAPGRRGYVPPLTLATLKAARRRDPDVVLAMHTLAAPGGLLAKRPTIVVCHGGELRSARIRKVARAVLPRARRVIANSRFTRSGAVALGADPMRTVVLPVGAADPVEVPDPAIAAVRARAGGPYVLSVSRLEPHKGQDRLVRAIAELPEARLVIVGEGSARSSLEQTARDAGTAERILFAGAVEDDQLAAWYAGASAFALLSRATVGPQGGVEGGGIALLEACSYGVPVVAANTGGIPETIHHGETGLLVEPDDIAAVTAALKLLLTDEVRATQIGERARAMATGERSWRRFVERLEQIVLQAARG